jgi:hypothetical protein
MYGCSCIYMLLSKLIWLSQLTNFILVGRGVRQAQVCHLCTKFGDLLDLTIFIFQLRQ